MAQKYQVFVISGEDPDDFSVVLYTSCDADRHSYNADLKEGFTEDGERIVASDWFGAPVELENLDGFATILIERMRNAR